MEKGDTTLSNKEIRALYKKLLSYFNFLCAALKKILNATDIQEFQTNFYKKNRYISKGY